MNRNLQDKVAVLTAISEKLEDALEKIDNLDLQRIEYMDDELGVRFEELRDRLIEKTAEQIKAVVLARL